MNNLPQKATETSAAVFAYGSMVSTSDWAYDLSSFQEAGFLSGYERHWRVAFDNLSTSRDHKFYVCDEGSQEGYRYQGFIASLGLRIAEKNVNGMVLGVDDPLLSAIDQREEGYYRIKVNDYLDADYTVPVFTYLPGRELLDNYRLAMAQGKIAVPVNYFNGVARSFREQESLSLEDYYRTTESISSSIPSLSLKLVRASGLSGL